MEIKHKFSDFEFKYGFKTSSAILIKTPGYKPEVMIVGTFNPDTPNTNFADFFYGRNFFWMAISNLLSSNLGLTDRRIPTRGNKFNLGAPTIDDIFKYCQTLKLTFADLISGVFHNSPDQYSILPNDNVVYEGKEYNLIQDNRNKHGTLGLAELDSISQVKWNTDNIVTFLVQYESITKIYFTRQSTGVWKDQWEKIVNDPKLSNRSFECIYTPSAMGNGLRVGGKMQGLIHHWLHNDHSNYGNLDHKWLTENGVKIFNFK